MSPGLALCEVSRRGSSAGGFRRAGLALRKPGSVRDGPGPLRARPRPDPAHTTSVLAALAGVVVLAAMAGVVADPVASDWGIAVRGRAGGVEGGSMGGSAGRRRFRSGRFVCCASFALLRSLALHCTGKRGVAEGEWA